MVADTNPIIETKSIVGEANGVWYLVGGLNERFWPIFGDQPEAKN